MENKKCLYIAKTSIPLSLCDNSAIVSYQGKEIELKFETVPPHGDDIYSIKIPNLDITLPFWVYGRNLMFLDKHFLIAESVRKNTWNPIESVVINISTGEYIGLDEWYHRVCLEENGVKLENDYTGESLLLKDISSLKWDKNIKNN